MGQAQPSRSTRIFVSHSRGDRPFADLLIGALRDAGADVARSDGSTGGGPRDETLGDETLGDETLGEIRARPTFLVVLSRDALASGAVQQECALAYALAQGEAGRLLLPVMAPDFGAYRASEAVERTLSKLALTPRRQSRPHSPPAPLPSSAAAPLIAQAHSFALKLLSPDALSEARLLFDHATVLSPTDVTAWIGLGDMCALLQRNQEALAAYERALALTPRNAELWCDAGAMRSRLGDHAGALDAYERALALDPDTPRALEQRGRMLVALDRASEAIAGYDAALARHADAAALWHARGNALQTLERHTEAVEAFDRALALWPHFAWAWRDKAAALRALGRHDEAYDAERRAAGWVS
jgi:tetratricopeptide (TPR) repeat protein